jgi:hypothetical protein
MKIKHSIFLVCACIFLSSLLYAQKKVPVKLGLKVSPSICWLNPSTENYESDGISGGVGAGFASDIYFTEQYALSTGFNFSFLNGKITYPDVIFSNNDTINGATSRKYNFVYLEIPLMLKMKTKPYGDFSFYGQIGFGTGFRLKAQAKDIFTSDGEESETGKIDFTEKTTLIRESVIVGLGMEYHLDESTRLFVGISYSNSLNNVLNQTSLVTGNEVKALLNYTELNFGILF